MRFNDIKKFKIDDLMLDEDNYRFMAAKDQAACVVKIFHASPVNFKNMMTSIAEDDLGELLLVYQNQNKNVVLDGNRRLAALKVLNNPEKFAPSEAIKNYAKSLTSEINANYSEIQAQVSSDKQLIFKTVYERHAAGQGKSRIGWTAYGAARFRYDQQTDDGNDWYAMAALLETEKSYPVWTSFIDSKDYSHEVFRRIFKSALDKGVISRAIFSDRHQRIKKSASKKLLKDAVEKTNKFLKTMKAKDISLSRNGKYADKSAVDAYIDGFELSPDNLRTQPPQDSSEAKPAHASNSQKSEEPKDDQTSNSSNGTTPSAEIASTAPSNSPSSGSKSSTKDKQGYGIDASNHIQEKLEQLTTPKLLELYKSLCVVSLKQHPQLLYAGAWSFFESLSTGLGKKEGTSFESYLGSHMNQMGYAKNQKKDFTKPLKDISDTGNLNKHSGTYYSTGAHQLRADFATLEPFICDLLDILITKKK